MIMKSPEEVMTRFVEFINTADEQLADEVIAPEALFHAPTHPEPLRGPSGYLELLAMLRSGFSDIQWTSASAQFPFGMSAHLWWPDDKAWCTATDIDLMTTYVGASTSCIDAILTNVELEALAVAVTHRLAWDTDTVNPSPACP
ncbi:hypothetical protein CH278_14555 [Rhodococcus sp. 05-2254-5]|uniref:ester cyclase n=1 Tax=unclassified Rhodococcus (in: high G+C Gram-positive bacteria) TaxID=192944 RepID=UPI000B9AA111|nr:MULTISPECIES: ester cyclase [unclassified Rhodococcus (in: high G+C Gram-positive bacteria)]OZE32668.1 hypothetical protein CH278_14555 [Rhodococcus sp. 05-2254-5]OZE48549.1 hypothetical protein CH269_26275 [Rhodococcus sp. 05-2254-1]